MPASKGNVPKRRGVYGWSLLNHIRYMAQKPLYYKPPPHYSAMLAVPPTQGPYRQKKKGKLFFEDDKLRTRLEPKSLWVRRDWRLGNEGFWSYGLKHDGDAIRKIKSIMAQGYSEEDALKIFETQKIDSFSRKQKQVQWVTQDQGFSFQDGIQVLNLLKQVNTSKENILKHAEETRDRIMDEKAKKNKKFEHPIIQDADLMHHMQALNAVNDVAIEIVDARSKLSFTPVHTDLKESSVVSPYDLFSIYITAFKVHGERRSETYKHPYYNGKSSVDYMDALYIKFRTNMVEFLKYSPEKTEKAMVNALVTSGIVEVKPTERPFVIFERAGVVPPDFEPIFKKLGSMGWRSFSAKMDYFRNRFELFYAMQKFQERVGTSMFKENSPRPLSSSSQEIYRKMGDRVFSQPADKSQFYSHYKDQ